MLLLCSKMHTHKKIEKLILFYALLRKEEKNPSGTFTLLYTYYIQNSPYSLLKSKILYSLTNLLKVCM